MDTDQARLCALFDEWGVPYKLESSKNPDAPDHVFVVVEQQEGNDKIVGYFDFHTVYEFTAEGKFVSVGAYE